MFTFLFLSLKPMLFFPLFFSLEKSQSYFFFSDISISSSSCGFRKDSDICFFTCALLMTFFFQLKNRCIFSLTPQNFSNCKERPNGEAVNWMVLSKERRKLSLQKTVKIKPKTKHMKIPKYLRYCSTEDF